MTLLQNILDLLRTEDAPVNNAGGGAVAGLGVGAKGEPGVDLRKRRKELDHATDEAGLAVQEDTPTQYFVGAYVSNDRKIKGTIHRVGSMTSGQHILTLKDAHSGKVIRDLKYSGGAAAKKAWLSIQKDGLDALQEAADDTFAGGDVMDVDLGRVMTALNPKKPWERFSKYVGIDEVGENIRAHARARENWKKNIILRDAKTGIMTYLRRRK
jgi:hypothetical protein